MTGQLPPDEVAFEGARSERGSLQRAPASGRRWLPGLAPWLGTAWMVVILLLGLTLAARIAGSPILGEAFETHWSEPRVEAAVMVYAVVFVPMLLAWLLRRQLTLLIGVVAVAAVLLAFGDATGSLPAITIVVVQAVLAWFVGLAIVSLVLPRDAAGISTLTWVAIGFAAGNGLLGLAYLGLGSFGLISAVSVVAVSVALVTVAVMILVYRGRPEMWWPRPAEPSFLETVLIALALAFAAWAMLFAFAPETLSDAIRHHLPITREIWQVGSVPEFAWWTSRYPIHAQLVTVPAWAVAGSAGVSLSHAVVGLAAALSVAALAEQLAGSRAAAVAFAAFVAMPLFLWEVGHAYVDLYPALFVVAAAVVVVLWQRLGPLRILVLAGFLAGLAFATKTTAATAVGALGLAVVLVGRDRLALQPRLAAGLAVAGGGLLVAPWLWRSFQITGQFPGLDLLTSTLLGTEREHSADLAEFGVGREPVGLLSIPWRVVFDGELFGQAGAGALGVLLLMALPLVLFAPRTRSLAFALALVGFGALAWAFTAQYLRYSLPLVAVAAALAGVGIASLGSAFARRGLGWMASIVLVLVGVAVVVAPVMSLPAKRNQVPLAFLSGELAAEEILAEEIPGYELLQVASDIMGPDTPVIWAGSAMAAAYTEVAPVQMRTLDVGRTDAQVRQALEDRGIEYLIWQVDSTSGEDWNQRIISPAFLKDHSTLVRKSGHTYLFALGEDLAWEQGSQLLPALDAVGLEGDWIPRGEVSVGGEGVTIPVAGNIKAAALVDAGATYAVRVRGACEDGASVVILVLWKDGNGITIGRDRQRVTPPRRGQTFVLTTAVEDAASAVIHFAPWEGACTVMSGTMRELINAP